MPTEVSFSANGLVTPTYVTLAQFTKGSASGVNDPNQFSVVAPAQSIEAQGDVDVFAVTLIAGQTYTFDIDGGAGDSQGGSVDLEIDLIDQKGSLVLSADGSSTLDTGSSSTLDPSVTVTVNQTGTYFIAVHAQADEYVDDQFRFTTTGSGGVGDYSLVVSTPSLPNIVTLTTGNDTVTYGSARDNVRGAAGNDVIRAGSGSDVIAGQDGNDTIYGDAGDDELSGAAGNDRLEGGTEDDVLVGGSGSDRLAGGAGRDALSGGADADTLGASDGDDWLWGEAGNDSLAGGSGNDFIRGGEGVDTMRGEAGADTFQFLPGESAFDANFREDAIVDFDTSDVIDLSDATSGTLSFIGGAEFTGANQVRVVNYRDSAGNGYQEVRVNLDADGTTELAFLVDTSGNFTLGSGDFLL